MHVSTWPLNKMQMHNKKEFIRLGVEPMSLNSVAMDGISSATEMPK